MATVAFQSLDAISFIYSDDKEKKEEEAKATAAEEESKCARCGEQVNPFENRQPEKDLFRVWRG